MNKRVFFIIVLLLIAGYAAYIVRQGNLKSQLLPQPQSFAPIPEQTETVCEVLPENLANDCFQKQALNKKDRSICGRISKPSEKVDCKREIDLLP